MVLSDVCDLIDDMGFDGMLVVFLDGFEVLIVSVEGNVFLLLKLLGRKF